MSQEENNAAGIQNKYTKVVQLKKNSKPYISHSR